MFGGMTELAQALGVDRSRISQWPPEGDLPQRDADRVMGAALRLGLIQIRARRRNDNLIVVS